MIGDLAGALGQAGLTLAQGPVSASALADLISLISGGTLSGKMAKEVFEEMFKTGKKPKELVEEKGLVQISDTGELDGIVNSVIEANPSVVEDFKSGKEKAFGFLVGQVMKETKGRANPKIINELLRKALSS